jgi:molybdopterin converting factor small subunit
VEVKVRFFTNLREIVNKREETLTFNAGEKVTVNLALKTLSQKYGNPSRNTFTTTKRDNPKISSNSSSTEQAYQH